MSKTQEKTIKIFGHQVPDTDTVVSAIIYAWHYNEVLGKKAEAFVLGSLNKETQYVLDRFDVTTPEVLNEITKEDQIVVVDTNNILELPDDVLNGELLEIIDHHKLSGGITTDTPVIVTLRPMASTASLIYTVMNPELHPIPHDIAGIMLAAIISDTLEFRSPTTTPEDKIIAETLAEQIGVDINELATKMFEAKSDITDVDPMELILMDSKVFEMNEQKVRVSVIETTHPRGVLDKKDVIKDAMLKHIAEDEAVDEVLLFVIDILKEQATPIVASALGEMMVEGAFGVDLKENEEVVLPGVVSRKKQIIPALQG